MNLKQEKLNLSSQEEEDQERVRNFLLKIDEIKYDSYPDGSEIFLFNDIGGGHLVSLIKLAGKHDYDLWFYQLVNQNKEPEDSSFMKLIKLELKRLANDFYVSKYGEFKPPDYFDEVPDPVEEFPNKSNADQENEPKKSNFVRDPRKEIFDNDGKLPSNFTKKEKERIGI